MASALSFIIGGVLPLLAIMLPPQPWRVPVTFVTVLLVLGFTGALSAKLGGSPTGRATVRVLVGGTVALGATFAIGLLLGTSGVG